MEVWLPWLEGAAPLVLVACAIWFVYRRPPRPAFAKIATAVGFMLVVATALLLSAFLLSAQGCEEDRALVGSPDGKHVARMMIWGSVPTGTSLRVIERRSWSPVWQEVSSAGSAGTPLEPIEPKLMWSDNSHLVIDYPEPSEGSGFTCDSKWVGDVVIVCKTHNRWSSRLPSARYRRDFCGGLSALCWVYGAYLGLRPRLVYVGPSALFS